MEFLKFTDELNKEAIRLKNISEDIMEEDLVMAITYLNNIYIEDIGDVLIFLSALNLCNAYVKNNISSYRKKIFLDVENYRSKRQETLEHMAKSMAEKVLNMKRSLKLEPMTSLERRIIHTCLQNIEHISTHSEGEDPNRFLVIDYVQ